MIRRNASSLRVIVTGLIAQHPTLGGVAWDYVQYALGLARLGHDVYYIEDSGEWPYTLDGGPSGNDWVARDPSRNVAHLDEVMRRFGLADRWAYRFPLDGSWHGLSDLKRAEVLRTADLLLNISGTLEFPEQYRSVPRLVYIDSDPVFTQVKIARGNADFRARVDAHDVHFSFGERIGPEIPTTGHVWRPTRQPMVLSEWRPVESRRPCFTTVMSWTSYEPLVYDGRQFGQKDLELRRVLDLPRRVAPIAIELALGTTHHVDWESSAGGETGRAPEAPQTLLRRHGWRIADPDAVCRDMETYRDYVRTSMAEWSVAKNGYVVGRPGWFSCRSACYLAAGRPVVVQDTGFSAVLPTGEGLLPFVVEDDAAEAVREVVANYDRHAAAALAIAHEYFDSSAVLRRLVNDAFDAAPRRGTSLDGAMEAQRGVASAAPQAVT